VIKRDY